MKIKFNYESLLLRIKDRIKNKKKRADEVMLDNVTGVTSSCEKELRVSEGGIEEINGPASKN